MRRSWALTLVLALVACETGPNVTPSLAPLPSANPTSSQTPPSAAPIATPPGATLPVAIDLPDGFDSIPWANAPSDADTDVFVVSIGVLGGHATTTRSSTHQPTVSADGRAVILEIDGMTEIVDAASGQTIATYDRDALELDDVPENNLNYYFAHRFITDVTRGYLYFLSANRDGVQLRRFELDGSHETRLAVLAPDPGRHLWYADLVLGPSGDVIATACPTEREKVADFRCRIYQAAAGFDGPIKPRYLPAKAPRPCFLIAASESWLIGSHEEFCHADGGEPAAIPYVAINLETLRVQTTLAQSFQSHFGVYERDGQPILVANLGGRGPLPSLYPAVGVELNFVNRSDNLGEFFHGDSEDYPDSPLFDDMVWAIDGWGADWSLLHAFGPEFAACSAAQLGGDVSACPSGPVMLRLPDGLFELPAGTWGEIVPPPGRASPSIGP